MIRVVLADILSCRSGIAIFLITCPLKSSEFPLMIKLPSYLSAFAFYMFLTIQTVSLLYDCSIYSLAAFCTCRLRHFICQCDFVYSFFVIRVVLADILSCRCGVAIFLITGPLKSRKFPLMVKFTGYLCVFAFYMFLTVQTVILF